METSILDIFKDDTTKQWSLTRLSSAVVLVSNFVYAAYSVFKTGLMPDLGNNWLLLVLALYGLNKTASTVTTVKAGGNEVQLNGNIGNN